jgi:hypothetical protein
MADNDLTEALAKYEAQHEFARRITLPVEDRLRYHIPGVEGAEGAYRWFRSPNVACIEKYRLLKAARFDG